MAPLAHLLDLTDAHSKLLEIMRAGPCPYCGCAMVPKTITAPTKEHLTPRSRASNTGGENVVIACSRCNHSKGDRTLLEFLWSGGMRPGAPLISVPFTARCDGPLPEVQSRASEPLPETTPILAALNLVHAAEGYFGEGLWQRSSRMARRALAWVAWQLPILPKAMIRVLRSRGQNLSPESLEEMVLSFDRSLQGSEARKLLKCWLGDLHQRGITLPVPRRPSPVRRQCVSHPRYPESSLRHPLILNPPRIESFPFIDKPAKVVRNTIWPVLPGVPRALLGYDETSE